MKRAIISVLVVLAILLVIQAPLGAQSTDSPTPVPVTAINLNVSAMTLVAGGQNGILRADIRPVNATDQRLIWSSSNTSVATVREVSSNSSDAVITPLAPGTSVISVRTRDGNFTATSTITVLASSPGVVPPLPPTGSGPGSVAILAGGLLTALAAVPVYLKSRKG